MKRVLFDRGRLAIVNPDFLFCSVRNHGLSSGFYSSLFADIPIDKSWFESAAPVPIAEFVWTDSTTYPVDFVFSA